jgi:acetyl-CoA carboxylase carboxyl transferase subunit alpha
MSKLEVPIVATIIGEGGSGGALALGVADRVNMMENAVYSVIAVEGCAAILWKDAAEAPRAAENLRLTAPELLKLKIIDRIVPEPGAGAHEEYDEAARMLDEVLKQTLEEASRQSRAEREAARYTKLRAMGGWLRPARFDSPCRSSSLILQGGRAPTFPIRVEMSDNRSQTIIEE